MVQKVIAVLHRPPEKRLSYFIQVQLFSKNRRNIRGTPFCFPGRPISVFRLKRSIKQLFCRLTAPARSDRRGIKLLKVYKTSL